MNGPTNAYGATYAELRIYDENVEPEMISRVLGLRPSRTSARTPVTFQGFGEVRQRPTTWTLSTSQLVDSPDVARHLERLLGDIASARSGLQELAKNGIQRCYVNLFWQSTDVSVGPSIPAEIMTHLAGIGLELSCSVQFFDSVGNWIVRIHPTSNTSPTGQTNQLGPSWPMADSQPIQTWHTPLDQDYGSADRAYAALHIETKVLSLDDITGHLGLQPTIGAIAGDTTTDGSGIEVPCDATVWQFWSEPSVDSLDLRHHLNWLESRLRSVASSISTLQLSGKVQKICVRCLWWSTEGHGGPILSPRQMRWMVGLGLPCEFRFYFSLNGMKDFRIPPN